MNASSRYSCPLSVFAERRRGGAHVGVLSVRLSSVPAFCRSAACRRVKASDTLNASGTAPPSAPALSKAHALSISILAAVMSLRTPET
eukprot:6548024-Prymnesium_polylepis.1